MVKQGPPLVALTRKFVSVFFPCLSNYKYTRTEISQRIDVSSWFCATRKFLETNLFIKLFFMEIYSPTTSNCGVLETLVCIHSTVFLSPPRVLCTMFFPSSLPRLANFVQGHSSSSKPPAERNFVLQRPSYLPSKLQIDSRIRKWVGFFAGLQGLHFGTR